MKRDEIKTAIGSEPNMLVNFVDIENISSEPSVKITCKICASESETPFFFTQFVSSTFGSDTEHLDIKRTIIEHLAVRHGIEIPLRLY